MKFKIPVTNDAMSSFTTTLNDKLVEIKTRYNSAMGIFLLDIAIPEDDRVVKGIPITTGVDLLRPFHFGVGTIIGYETTREFTESTRENFGLSYLLLTEPPDEL
jgi:hypothetical protein